MRLVCCAIVVGLCTAAHANTVPEHVDTRHQLNRPYADPGAVVPDVPHYALAVPFGEDHYWVHEGIWYRADGEGYVVVRPPLGIIVPVLPRVYVTLSVGGTRYYYANDTYYAYVDDANGFEVVAPPAGADQLTAPAPTEAFATPTALTDPQYVYPRLGQSPPTQATDRYECHHWAVGQSGFDPTLTSGGVAPEIAEAKRTDYIRAMNACLEARGYTVR